MVISSRPTKLFFAPTAAFIMVLSAFPFLYAIIISLTDYRLASNSRPSFVGIANYVALFHDQLFFKALQNTLFLVAAASIAELLIGSALALSLFSIRNRLSRALQTLIVLPLSMTPVGVALMWKYLLNSTYGLVNYLLAQVGMNPIDWLGSEEWALVSVAVVDVWQWTPLVVLIILAGLESIPSSTIDMAKADGASEGQVITRFIVPLLKNFIIVALLLRAIDSFKLFDTVYVL